ncbi:PREDICTED: mediator of DNA damage checkpoint protein 1 isoform X8 [Myotis brandtii]|uniref:mediator of DNA damage checkpoint protein 1 isoform X8 n=1 Tax=Myotis brandtii TaxID=109478 RepID=UPI0007047420|nr:PREDICTED: mediator of DNA damage checkpoint protein 1 isoform X8 [Myotis brandtii]
MTVSSSSNGARCAVMEDTQAVNWEAEEEEETERPSDSLGCSLEPLGRLHVFSSAHGPEKDPLSERYVANEPRTMSSLLATVVPESDEEGPSSAPDGPGPPSAFNLDSDTDEEESQQPAAGWASSAATRDATAETEQPEAVRTEIQVEKDPSLGQERNSDIRVKRDASNGVILERSQPPGEDSETDVEDESRPPGKPAEGHLERAQPSGFIDSDTDVEEEAIPTTPAVVPMKRRQIFHGVNAESPGGPDLAHLHESPAGSETDVEEAEAPLTVPLERSQASMVSNSNVDDEEGVSAALTLVHLKESRATAWNRDTDVEEDRAQPPAFLEQSQTSTGRDSDTDMEVEGFPVEKRGYVPKSHTDKAQPEKSPPPFGDSDREVEEEKSSPGVLERSQASATVGINTPLEEEVSPGPAVTLPGKHEVPVAGTNPTNVEAEGGPAKLPAVHLEEAQPPPDTGTAGEPTQAQRKGAQPPRESGGEPHVDMTKNCGHSHDDSEDLDQQATQCFVERENQSPEAVPRMEDEPTQAFLFTPPQEPGPSHCSFQASGGLDEPWEVLATQPFCLRESEASETQPIATHLEAHGSCPLSPRPTPQDQHLENPFHAEPLGIQGGGLQTSEKGIGPLNCKMSPAEKASRGDPGSLDVCLPPAVPEASAPVQNSLIPQSQKHLASQPLFAPSPPLESPIPSSRQNGSQEALENPLSSELDPLHAKSKCRPQGCSRMTPSPASIAPELHPATSREQPVPPEPTSRATRGRTHRASVRTPEPTVPTDQPVPPELTSQATRGRTHRASVRTPEPTVPTDQPVPPELTSQATRGRTHRASVRTPEPTVPTDQPVPPELTSQATRGRTHRASVRTPEPTVPTDQPVPPELTSQATRGRTHRASVKTPEPTVPTDQPVPPEPTSQATRGRTHRASVKTPEPTVPTDQPVPPEPTSQATRGRTHRASVRTPEPTVPTAPDLEPPTPTDQPVTPKAIAQGGRSRTLRSTRSAVPVPTTPESQSPFPTDQPIPPEPIPQANCSRRPRVARQPLAVPIVYEPCSAPLEPNAWSSRSQRRGAVRATKSLRTIPEPAFAQLPGAPTHALQIQKIEATGGYEFSPGSPPKAFQNHKKPSDTVDSPPLPKRLRREVPQKTVVLKEEEEEKPGKEEDVVMPGPGKRKRDQAEEEPKGMPVRSLRQTKPSHESAAPKVLFTGVVDARGEQAVLALGGSLASSVAEASHLVTDRICRTVKFLCALGRGIPILSLDWLYQSRKAGCFLPPDDYVVTDPEQEKNFGFSLRDSLSRARERRLLEGYEIHVTPGVQPPPPQMGEIISCCGGTVLPSMPRSYKPQRVVITCSQDAPRCTTPFRVGLPILSPEFLLTGVLKQEAKPEAFVLSTLEMASP